MSWLKYEETTHFPVQNLPFGVFEVIKKKDKKKKKVKARVGTRIGDFVICLKTLTSELSDFFTKESRKAFKEPTLNKFMSLEPRHWSHTRAALTSLFNGTNDALKKNKDLRKDAIFPIKKVRMLLPADIGDYTDCYASIDHATNVGSMFRDPSNPLLPNWRHIPIGYHGRASSIVVSGTPVKRPCGQTKAADADLPSYGPSRLLDFELEVGVFVGGTENPLGEPIDMASASNRLFGLVLLHDWSARDIQKWEYVPLGPFCGKNFCSTISPWVVTFEALRDFVVPSDHPQIPTPLPYLIQDRPFNFDVNLNVTLTPENASAGQVISRSNMKYLYWSFKQQLVHHSSTGCNMRAGDLIGSGTISGPDSSQYGSMLEISWKGSKPLKLDNGEERKFLADGDTVTLSGYAQGHGFRIGFGECSGKIIPANQ